ncbi:efflux RND transporter periplasmic adaptor subunit [Roseomonas sp. GC11]|uniref:efflux RND transporter periplasmic adaptor subunit n=1 Tax=Roseomonas sp. GC11 TaxID=2950546 RepID=UPI00210AAAC1|nr:efflux RND transporter periplasmic adaptor subunit [Roseomonas sp. GC11]MCQ4159245.1 efflux RND transporter periplasmic adaptor subunit [Roseomonas sp. GC11]
MRKRLFSAVFSARAFLSPALGLLAALPAPFLATTPAMAQEQRPDFPCQVFAAQRVELASPVPGVLAEVKVERGDRVTAGQVVAQLRTEMEQAQLALAQARASADAQLRLRRARLALADRTLSRNQGLNEQRLISQQELDQIRTERDVAAMEVATATENITIARAELEQVRAALAIRTLRSPISGIVTERGLQAGEQVRDKPVMVIENVDSLHVEVALPAALFGRLRMGARGRLSFPGTGLASLITPVSLIDSVVDARSDMFGVRFVLDNRQLRIPAGLKCRAELELTP